MSAWCLVDERGDGGYIYVDLGPDHDPLCIHDEAIARLIAAAPDLLAALKALAHVAVWDDDTDREEFDAAYALAKAAIAKAEATHG